MKVVAIADKQIAWPWTGQPYINIPKLARGFYTRQVQIDPFPAYAHDLTLVNQTAAKVARAFPIAQPVTIHVLPRETPERTNGCCEITHNYQAKKPYPWGASIILWGKRIPPHPAMTRYLVSHEYGHAVAHQVALNQGHDQTDPLYKEYRKLRPRHARPRYYGGGTWHISVSEWFANDFRILVTETEPEFWPHPGIVRPDKSASVRDFWKSIT